MRLLLRLYPSEWRGRYGAEMDAMLCQGGRLGPRDTIDLLRGALDARLRPQVQHRWRRTNRRARRPAARALLGIAALLAVGLAVDRLLTPVTGAGWAWLAAGAVEVGLWGGVVALVLRARARRRRRRRPDTDPPAGAPVSARPRPDPPQPLEARGRRAS